MSDDRLNNQTGGADSTEGARPEHPLEHVLDVIARNPKDTGKPGEQVQVTQVGRNSSPPAPAAGPPLLPGHAWGGNPPMQAAPSGTELLGSILRFKWTIVILFILVSAPIIAAIWTQIIPQYQARAEVQVRPIIPRLVFRTDDNGMIPLYDSFVNTQVSFIRSLTVLQRVLDQPAIQETQWYKNPPKSLFERLRGNTIPPMERLRDGLSVRPRPRTEIIDVSFTNPSAKDARLIVDAVLDQYIKYVGDKSDATADQLYRQLTEQYRTLDTEIQGREKICAELHKSLGTETPQELVSSKRIRLDGIQASLSELRNRITIIEWEMKQAAPRDGNDTLAAPMAGEEKQPKYYQDAEWRTLDRDVRTMEHQMTTSLYAPNHPNRVRLTKDLEFAKESLRLREKQLDEQWRDRPRMAVGMPLTATDANGPAYREGTIPVEYQLARAKQEETLLQAELQKQQAEFKTLFESAQLLDKENNTLRNKRDLFSVVRQRLDEKNVERNVPGSIGILMGAYSPTKPASDRRVVFTVMALFAGFGLGGGVAFLRASRNQAIYTAKDMPQPVQAPLLGHVPLVRIRKSLGASLYDEMEQNRCLLTESIRVLRTALLSRLDGQGHATILVTSANEGTGKSSFTTMLGKSIAQAGKKVLIIDADIHKMTLSSRFELLDKPGLIESLSGKAVDGLPIFPTKTPGLDVMPCGKRGSDDVVFEEIANGAFKACIARLIKECGYDIILLDSPPILPVADATILAGQVDGTIMVEREHVSHRTDVADALIRLGSAGGRLLGTVFVGSSGRRDYGYAYRYSHYYAKSNES